MTNKIKNITSSNDKIEKSQSWYIVDAENHVLGRLSSFIAIRLMGKHKTDYSQNIICGDKIIVINAKKIVLTGKKLEDNKYWHTGYPGGIKSKTFKDILESHPTLLIKNCVKNMLKKGPLGKKQLKNLYIFSNDKHPYESQNPTKLNLN
tara:strand:+ start:260 stop:706 length:447 start_codon:yes stop_codon:yes gene_type:complete